MMHQDFFQTLYRVAQRLVFVVVARVGTKSSALRAHLAEAMNGTDHAASFVREPYIEAAHSYVRTEQCLQDLSGGLLGPKSSMHWTARATGPEDRPRNRFRREVRPFRHQVEAWRALLDPNPKSAIISSGTGSGKTECFLVPLLNTLRSRRPGGPTGRHSSDYPVSAKRPHQQPEGTSVRLDIAILRQNSLRSLQRRNQE